MRGSGRAAGHMFWFYILRFMCGSGGDGRCMETMAWYGKAHLSYGRQGREERRERERQEKCIGLEVTE